MALTGRPYKQCRTLSTVLLMPEIMHHLEAVLGDAGAKSFVPMSPPAPPGYNVRAPGRRPRMPEMIAPPRTRVPKPTLYQGVRGRSVASAQT